MTSYAHIIEVVGPVPMPDYYEWEAYQEINESYLAALELGQVPAGVDRVVQVGNVVVVPNSQGLFMHLMGWYVNDPSDTVIADSPYLRATAVTPADFHA